MRLPFLSARPPRVTRYQIASPRWTAPPLTLALLSDLHINQPWTSLSYLDRIVDQTNQLGADAILLLGDYVMDRNMRKLGAHCPDWSQIIRRLTQLEAPLGVHGILGNHDWKPFPPPSDGSPRRNLIAEAFAEQGLALLQNQSQRLDHGPDGIWLVGLDSQRSHKIKKPRLRMVSLADAEAAYADLPQDSLSILLAHEPDYFALGDRRPVVQLSGHTHGGQFRLFGRTPKVPSIYGDRYNGGHIVEHGRDLVVSCGIGYSGLPLRIGVPAEIVLLTIICA